MADFDDGITRGLPSFESHNGAEILHAAIIHYKDNMCSYNEIVEVSPKASRSLDYIVDRTRAC